MNLSLVGSLVHGRRYFDPGPTVSTADFYGKCQTIVDGFDGKAADSRSFCDCIRSGNSIKSFNNSDGLLTMHLHSFLPLSNKLEYPAGEQLKWANYLTLFHINSYADDRIRIHTQLWDTNCSMSETSDAIAEVFIKNTGAGIIGPSCTPTAELTNGFTPFLSSASTGFSVEGVSLENRFAYSTFYRLASPSSYYVNGFTPVAMNFNWTKLIAIVSGNSAFQDAFNQIIRAQQAVEVDAIVRLPMTEINVESVWWRLMSRRTRIVLIMTFQHQTQAILCAGYHKVFCLYLE